MLPLGRAEFFFVFTAALSTSYRGERVQRLCRNDAPLSWQRLSHGRRRSSDTIAVNLSDSAERVICRIARHDSLAEGIPRHFRRHLVRGAVLSAAAVRLPRRRRRTRWACERFVMMERRLYGIMSIGAALAIAVRHVDDRRAAGVSVTGLAAREARAGGAADRLSPLLPRADARHSPRAATPARSAGSGCSTKCPAVLLIAHRHPGRREADVLS